MFDGIEGVRAIIAMMYRDQDIRLALADNQFKFHPAQNEVYLGMAQQLLESSYQNFVHPAANMTQNPALEGQ